MCNSSALNIFEISEQHHKTMQSERQNTRDKWSFTSKETVIYIDVIFSLIADAFLLNQIFDIYSHDTLLYIYAYMYYLEV